MCRYPRSCRLAQRGCLPQGPTYDALKFIDEATGEPVYQDWDDDVFEVPG